jgi:DNA-binding LacI/PurR family transcriptional regulator
VAGFDASVGARFCSPALTTVGHPLDALAGMAVRALIRGEVECGADLEIFSPFPFQLLARGSTARPASEG